MTMARDTLDNLAKTLADTLPEGLRSMREDVERNFRAVLASGIDKLDLVTREEFEVQQAPSRKTTVKRTRPAKKPASRQRTVKKPAR